MKLLGIITEDSRSIIKIEYLRKTYYLYTAIKIDIFTFFGQNTLGKLLQNTTRENKVPEAELSGKGYRFFCLVGFCSSISQIQN